MKLAGDKAVIFHRQIAKIKDLRDEDEMKLCELDDYPDAKFQTIDENYKGL